jgi:hypothetical protein
MSQEEFNVVYLTEAEASIREFTTKAINRGLLDSFHKEVAQFQQRLQRDPFEVGELIRKRGNILFHAARGKMIGLEFGIDAGVKLVAVVKCWPTPTGGLLD